MEVHIAGGYILQPTSIHGFRLKCRDRVREALSVRVTCPERWPGPQRKVSVSSPVVYVGRHRCSRRRAQHPRSLARRRGPGMQCLSSPGLQKEEEKKVGPAKKDTAKILLVSKSMVVRPSFSSGIQWHVERHSRGYASSIRYLHTISGS